MLVTNNTVFIAMETISPTQDMTNLYMGLAGVCLILVTVFISLIALVFRIAHTNRIKSKRCKLGLTKQSNKNRIRFEAGGK